MMTLRVWMALTPQHWTRRLMASMRTLTADTTSMMNVGDKIALGGQAPLTDFVELYFRSVRIIMTMMTRARMVFRMYWIIR